MREIHLYVDYGWFPVWEYGDAEQTFKHDFDPSELPITQNLAEQLNEWSEKYDATLDQSYPPDSGFSTKEESLAFARRGIELGKQLQKELGPDFKVFIDFTVEDFEDYVRQ